MIVMVSVICMMLGQNIGGGERQAIEFINHLPESEYATVYYTGKKELFQNLIINNRTNYKKIFVPFPNLNLKIRSLWNSKGNPVYGILSNFYIFLFSIQIQIAILFSNDKKVFSIGIPINTKKGIIYLPGPIHKSILGSYYTLNKLSTFVANGDAYKITKQNYPKLNLKFINKAVDYKKFCVSNKLKKDNVILFVGRLTEIKDPLFAIDSFYYFMKNNKNKDYILKIIGDGPLKEKVVVRIKELNLQSKIKLCGFKDKMELEYKTAKALIITSKYENYPNVICEASASRVLVFSVAVGGIKDYIINSKNGYIYKKINAKDFSDRMSIDINKNNVELLDFAQKQVSTNDWNKYVCFILKLMEKK